MRKFICHLVHKSGNEEIEIPMWAESLEEAHDVAEDTYSHFYEITRVRPAVVHKTDKKGEVING